MQNVDSMLKKTIFLLVVLLLCVIALVQGQNVDFVAKNFTDKEGFSEAMKNMKKGDEYFAMKKPWMYPQAIENYLKAQQFNPNNAVLNFKIGVCYLNSCEKAASLPYFQKAKELNPKVDPKINYALAQSLHYSLMFDEAAAQYSEYLEKDVPEKDRTALEPQIQKKKLECRNGLSLVASPVAVTIENMGSVLNSPYNDYTPLTTKVDSFLIFTSRQTEAAGKVQDKSKDVFEDIYISRKEGNGWSKPAQLSKNISGSADDAATALIQSGYTLLLYKGVSGGGDIYESNLDETGQWTVPRAVADMNSPYHESSAFITEDGQTAFVVSNIPDKTLGGHDIFVMKRKEDGSWSSPVSIGLDINTPYEEEGVFASPDGTILYFSSKGHNSMGGYDVFRSVFKDGEWQKPVNLGYPLNTPDDDLYLIAFGPEGSEEGYFTSSRAGGHGLNDIYYYRFTPPVADLRSSAADSVTSDTTFAVDLYKGEPSDAFVTMNDGSKQSEKQSGNESESGEGKQSEKQSGNESVVRNTETASTQGGKASGTETTGESKSTTAYIPQQTGVVFHVQVGASRKPMPKRELHARYPGVMDVTTIQHEGWYKYLIGRYEKYSEAKTLQRTCGTPDAWVVVYKNGQRVHIREVSDMLTYHPNAAMVCSLLHIL